MNIKEAASEYPELDLYELARRLNTFLEPYPFVQSASLYRGKKWKYHIGFETVIPEGYVEIKEEPATPKPITERIKEFFKIDEQEAPVLEKPMEIDEQEAPEKTMVKLYAEFRENIASYHPVFDLHLDEVYQRDKIGPKPLGPAPYDNRPTVEWWWGENEYNLVLDEGVFLYPLHPLNAVDAPAPAPPATATTVTSEEKPVNFFTRGEDKHWRIGFNGKEANNIDPLDGLLYIAYILEKHGTSISCRNLYYTVPGRAPDNLMSEGEAIDTGLSIGDSKQSMSDYEAKQKYWKRYKELGDDLLKINDLPDNYRTPEHEMEKKEIEKEMEGYIPFLKERTFTDPNDKKAQINIGKRLETAYAAIRKSGMKKMTEHLQKHIKTDGAYGLTYTGPYTWGITTK